MSADNPTEALNQYRAENHQEKQGSNTQRPNACFLIEKLYVVCSCAKEMGIALFFASVFDD